jgi:hypothetical protein
LTNLVIKWVMTTQKRSFGFAVVADENADQS